MKKQSLYLVMLSLLALTGCGNKGENPTSSVAKTSQPAISTTKPDAPTSNPETSVKESTSLKHTLVEHPAVDFTCTRDGNTAYYEDPIDHKYYSDKDGEHEIEEGSWIIQAHHIYDTDYTFDETSTYPNFKMTRTCSVDGYVDTKIVDGYDFADYDFGVTWQHVTQSGDKDNPHFERDGEVQKPTYDPSEKGLIFPFNNPHASTYFAMSLPKMDYTKFEKVTYSFTVINIVKPSDGDSGFVCFSMNKDRPDWKISTANQVRVPITLEITTSKDGKVSAYLSGSFDGNSQRMDLSDDIAKGQEAMTVFCITNDGYRDVLLSNPVIREKRNFSAENAYGCGIKADEKTLAPTFAEGYHFDLKNQGIETKDHFELSLPTLNYRSYHQIYFPLMAAFAGEHHADDLTLSLNGTDYFNASEDGYLQFLKDAQGRIEVSYLADHQEIATLELTDEDVIKGKNSFVLYGKTKTENLTLDVKIPVEGSYEVIYDFSKYDYDAKVIFKDQTEIKPVKDSSTYYLKGKDKLSFSLSKKQVQENDYFNLALPKINLTRYTDFFLPLFIEKGCTEGKSELQFSFDKNTFFDANHKAKDNAYLHFAKKGNGYEVSYLIGTEEKDKTTINDNDILKGKKSLEIQGTAEEDVIFSIGEPRASQFGAIPVYSDNYFAGSRLTVGDKEYQPTYSKPGSLQPIGDGFTDKEKANYQDALGKAEMRYDLTDKATATTPNFDLALPLMDLSAYDKITLPFYFECGCQNGNSHTLQFSFDGTTYFDTDNENYGYAEMTFTQADGGYQVTYSFNHEVKGTYLLQDETVISGEKNFVIQGKVGVNWRRILIGEYFIPEE